MPGDLVHVKKVGVRGMQKMVDRWEHGPFWGPEV